MAHNLPLQLTSFIGREREQAELRTLLAGTRLLTLTGSGGAGKTRLALRVAGELVDKYADGVWLVEFASLGDGALVSKTVASVLGVPEAPGRPLDEVLSGALQPRSILLILDNCEHVLPFVARLADGLLRTCPRVRILATSREALNIAGETVWRVPSLTLPAAGAASANRLRASDAVRLFEERAQAVVPGFELTLQNAPAVAEVCRRLDGMPLSIELAAARVRLLSVNQVAARLDDRFRLLTGGSRTAPTRQQTLRATIEWSYSLLSEQEQLLFDRLAVFAGGWTLEAAEAVAAGDGIDANDLLDLLGRLVDKSLAQAEPSEDGTVRFCYLETLRGYGQERLRGRGEADAVAERHALFFIDFAEQATAGLFGAGELQALRQLEPEHDNVRAALRWLVDRGDMERGRHLAANFGMFWFFRGHLSEGRRWLDHLLIPPLGHDPTPAAARCLFIAADLALAQGDYTAMRAWAERALAASRQLDDGWGASASLYQLGLLAKIRGDDGAAVPLLEEAATAGRAAGNHAFEGLSLMWLAQIAASRRNFAEAQARAEEARLVAAQVGWERLRGATAMTLADIYFEQQDDHAARLLIKEADASLHVPGTDPWFISMVLSSSGQIAAAQGDFRSAQTALSEALARSQQIGDRSGIVAALRGFAYLACAQGQDERAACLASAANELHRQLGGILKTMSPRVEGTLAASTRSLRHDVLRSAQLRGQRMAQEEAATYALEDETRASAGRDSATSAEDKLTSREREVAALVAKGFSNLEIADQLVLSERTVESHVRNVLAKFGLRSRAHLAGWAAERRLTPPSPD